MSSDCLVRLGNQIISGKLTTAALPALLQLDSMREVLRHDAQHLPGRPQQGEQCGNAHTLVVAAAATGQPEALDALLAAGGAITLQAVNAAVQRGVRWDAEESMVMLRLLLSRGVPAVPAEVPDTAAALQTCPIYVLLERQEGAHECVSGRRPALAAGWTPNPAAFAAASSAPHAMLLLPGTPLAQSPGMGGHLCGDI